MSESVETPAGRVTPQQAYVVWPPPLGAEVDPYHFGVSTGESGPRGRRLNLYVPRDVDGAVQAALRDAHGVVLMAPHGAGATRTMYEAVGRVLPRSSVCIAQPPGAFRPTGLLELLPPSFSALLWLDQFGAHWRASEGSLWEAVRSWLARKDRYFAAVCYENDAAALAEPDFEELGIPLVRMAAELSPAELHAQRELLGAVMTRTHLGFDPPIRSQRFAPAEAEAEAVPTVESEAEAEAVATAEPDPAEPVEVEFSPVVRLIGEALGEGEVTASDIAARLRVERPEYAGGRLGAATIPPDAGPRQAVSVWLAEVRDCYDDAAVRGSGHDVIDGRLTLAALSTMDSAVRRALGPALLEALAKECEVWPRARPLRQDVQWLADEPVASDADKLGRVAVTEALREQLIELTRNYPGRSFLVHIDGVWGAGKSTLLRFLAEGVRRDGWLVVPYDAWRQSKAGPPWLTVLHGLRDALKDRLPSSRGRAWFWLRERTRLVGARHWVALAVLLTLGGAATAWLTAAGLTMSRSGDLMKLVGAVLSATATIWLAASSLGRFVLLDSRRSARTFLETRAEPMEALAEHFDWVLRQAGQQPVILLVDDLDRCTDSFVVDLLDSVQKLMRDPARRRRRPPRGSRPSLIVVVAADGRWIRSSYDNVHASLAGTVVTPGATVGSLFLEKLFQLTVPLPRLSEELKTEFLTSLLADRDGAIASSPSRAAIEKVEQAPPERLLEVMAGMSRIDRLHASDVAIQRMVIAPEARRRTEHVLQPYSALLDPTPRAMKRFVMAYSMQRTVQIAEGSVAGVGPLALWTILQLRWPLLAEFLQADPMAVRLFAMPAGQLPDHLPAAVRPLFVKPPAALRAVMNHPDGPLDERALRECSGLETIAASTKGFD